MKGAIDIFSSSQPSKPLSFTMEINEASSSSSSSSFSSAAAVELGGRALDRHNPTICDGRRNPISTNSLLTPPRDFSQPNHKLSKPNKPSSKLTKKTKPRNSSLKQQNDERENYPNSQSTDHFLKKNAFIPTGIVSKSFAKLSDLVAPPPAGSSRFLLGSDRKAEFDGGSPELEAVFDVVPAEEYKDVDVNGNGFDESCSSATGASFSQQPEVKPTPIKQVVVLMVSLHCKGCEGKVRKHLSRMKGVTSFNIDNKAKKVTIEGDVTPVGVLASVSKLKHAKFWTSEPPPQPPPTPPPQPPSSTSPASASTSATTETPNINLINHISD